MIKDDNWIIKQCKENGMIQPFVARSVRKVDIDETQQRRIVSMGMSSYGYDLTLCPHSFYVCKNGVESLLVDVKKSDKAPIFKELVLNTYSNDGDYFILPPQTVGFGTVNEHLKIPTNVTGIGYGKSTYGRVGVNVYCTPFEAGWQGFATIQIFNALHYPVKLYANEGIVQMIFLEGEQCDTSYADRGGKYQNEGQEVTFSRM